MQPLFGFIHVFEYSVVNCSELPVLHAFHELSQACGKSPASLCTHISLPGLLQHLQLLFQFTHPLLLPACPTGCIAMALALQNQDELEHANRCCVRYLRLLQDIKGEKVASATQADAHVHQVVSTTLSALGLDPVDFDLHYFGSMLHNVVLPGSDVDIVCMLPDEIPSKAQFYKQFLIQIKASPLATGVKDMIRAKSTIRFRCRGISVDFTASRRSQGHAGLELSEGIADSGQQAEASSQQPAASMIALSRLTRCA